MAKKPNVKLVAALSVSLPDLYCLSQPTFPSYPVTVDYGHTVEALIKAGKHDWSNSYITSCHFQSTEKGKAQVDIYLVSFDRHVSSEQAIEEMNDQGLRPATLKELLSLGIDYPELQLSDPIVALGSSWRHSDGILRVPCLYALGSYRNLYLDWWDGGWNSDWRFAAVRK